MPTQRSALTKDTSEVLEPCLCVDKEEWQSVRASLPVSPEWDVLAHRRLFTVVVVNLAGKEVLEQK